MTIEEKAKAYDEALEKARQIHNGNPSSGTAIVVCEQIFPQLRESEDERIRKWLYDYISNCPNDNFTFYGGVGKDAVLNYLEKQKEPKKEFHIPDYMGMAHYNPAPIEQKEQNEITIEQVYKEFINPEKLKGAKTNKYIRAQLLWELMHNGIITAVDYQYLTDDKRKPWTEEEYLKAYRKGFDVSEQLKQKEQKLTATMNGEPIPTENQSVDIPLAEWSEEDESCWNLIWDILDGPFTTSKEGYKKAADWFLKNCPKGTKSIRPSWKPSEEQMEAFRKYIEDFQARAEAAVGGWNNFDVMIRLYEQLKKL